MRPARKGAARNASPVPGIIPLALVCVALFAPTGCSRNDNVSPQLEAARSSYQETRTRAADLEEFFLEMEGRLGREQDEALRNSIDDLVEEGRRAYDSFLRNVRDTRAAFEEVKSSGGKEAEYADRLLGLLEANQAEAMLVAESLLQAEEFARQLPLSSPSVYVAFTQRINELAESILSSRDTIRRLETEAEEFYQSL